jgi:hypothetical protein
MGAIVAAAIAASAPDHASAQGAPDTLGWLKTSKGEVSVLRGGATLPGTAGMALQRGDVIETGADGTAGITLEDNSLLSAGPRSQLVLDEFTYDSATITGRSLATLKRGTLSATSGDIARGTPGAMRIRTPTAVLAVRGTTFLVRVEE